MGGDHGMLEKRSLYEESSNVPLLIHVSELNNNKKTNIKGSISQVDLVPTILISLVQKFQKLSMEIL